MTATQTNPSNSPAGVVSTNTKASMPTASVGRFDLPPPTTPLPENVLASGVPLFKSGQGREAPDADQLFTIVISMLYGAFIGALCGSLFTWLVMGGGQ